MLVKKQYYWDCSQPSKKKTMSKLTSYAHYKCIVVTIIIEWGWVWYEEFYRRCYTPRPKAKVGNRLWEPILQIIWKPKSIIVLLVTQNNYVKVLNKLASSKTLFKTFACLLAPLQNNEEIFIFCRYRYPLKRWQHSPCILHSFSNSQASNLAILFG